MTDRLYYDQSYLTSFDARVVAVEERDGRWHVRLNQSAFYPTSGGQPYDTGVLGDARVEDVYVDGEEEVWHVVDRPLEAGTVVHGEIDWPRRFDHMQQHAADHMIASALHRLLGGVTIGLHVSGETSTIDVAMPDGALRISPEDIRRVEMDVNERVQRDVPIRCWFPSADELARLPLRKAPTVREHVRVVAIGEDEMVACGGTHPSSAGQIGLVKILSVAPARGKMRVCFVAGMRAFRDYQLKFDCAAATANLFSTSVDKMHHAASAMQAHLKQAESELAQLRRQALFAKVDAMMGEAPRLEDGTAVIAARIEGDVGLMRDLASHMIRNPGVTALLSVEAGGRAMFVFARSEDVPLHMGRLLSAVAKPLGGKGGGRPDFAQGGGPSEMLEAARDLLLSGRFH